MRSKVLRKGLLVLAALMLVTGTCFAERITIKGSTTVFPIAQRCAEEFMKKYPQADISVGGGGSGVGIGSLIDGTTDIGDASRAIKDKELDKAVANGVDPVAHVVAMDGIAVIVHPSNGINALTKQQIKDIYTGKVSNWSQVGGTGGKIVVISRDSASGTFEAFNKLALNKAKVRKDSLLEASNQAVVSVVSKTPGAIGYCGLGYVRSAVKPVTVDGVKCTKETVLLGTYPLGRPLFMYTDGQPSGMVGKFISFVKGKEGQQLAEEEGFVGLQ